MENEDDYGQLTVVRRLGDIGIGHPGTKGFDMNPVFNTPNNKEIAIPPTFKEVIVKMRPEIADIVSVGYREQLAYDPANFSPRHLYLVGVDLYFENIGDVKLSKKEYGKEIMDYFKMTYGSDMEFISFHVQSLIFPPEKTNKEKFLELFEKV